MNRPLRLLLVDDDEVDRQSVLRALRRSWLNFDIVLAETAAIGLACASEQRFDAILLDYQLPDQNGIDVLHTLRNGQLEGMAVIMLTGQEDDTLATRCLEAGAQDFLLKDEVNGRRLSRAVLQAQQRFKIEEALERGREQLRELVDNDSLTGLLNRQGFEAELAAMIERTKRSSICLSMVLMEANDFKRVNDILGRDFGDEMLKELAGRLGAAVRSKDILCRLGGGEFAVLLADGKAGEQALRLADRIIGHLSEPLHLGDTLLPVTTSIGIAVVGQEVDHARDLLKCAGIAKYHARQEGLNKRKFYSASMQQAIAEQVGMLTGLRQGVGSGNLRVYYQAQTNAADGGHP